MKPLTHAALYRLVFLMVAVTIPFILGSFFSMHAANRAVAESVSIERKMRTLGDRMNVASDCLTDEVRAFSVAGDRAYLAAYWEEADVARSRDNAIEEMAGIGIPADEMRLLVNAKRESDALMGLEVRAMRLMADFAGIDGAQLPSRVADFRLPPEDALLSPEKKREKAQSLLHSTEYSEAKKAIRASINEFKSMALRRTERSTNDAQRKTAYSFALLAAALAFLAIDATAISLLSFMQLSRPMLHYMRALSAPSPDGRLPELKPFGGAGPRAMAQIFNARREEIIRYETELENAKLRSDAYFHFLPLAAVETDDENVVTMWNPAAERLFGYLASEAIGKGIVDLLVPEETRPQVLDSIERAKLTNGVDDQVNANRTKGGREILCEWCKTPIFDSEGRRTGWASIVRDVTEERREAEQILYLARHDPLTGLLNRRHMTEKIAEELARLQRSTRPFSLIMLDIDFFKTFNDTYGHDCGDAVLKEISATIRRSVRKTDSVGRWGGEEFLVLLPETEYRGAGRIAEKIRKGIEDLVIRHQDRSLRVTITAGYSTSCGREFEECVKAADEALLKGKTEGRNRTVGAPPCR